MEASLLWAGASAGDELYTEQQTSSTLQPPAYATIPGQTIVASGQLHFPECQGIRQNSLPDNCAILWL